MRATVTSPETTVLHQLRSQWLAAIVEFGPSAAKDDAVLAFMDRMRCSRKAAEAMVERAWSKLNLDVRSDTLALSA
jgi:hypothetical protein